MPTSLTSARFSHIRITFGNMNLNARTKNAITAELNSSYCILTKTLVIYEDGMEPEVTPEAILEWAQNGTIYKVPNLGKGSIAHAVKAAIEHLEHVAKKAS